MRCRNKPSEGTAIVPYTELEGYPWENQTQNPRKDAILAVVLPLKHSEYT